MEGFKPLPPRWRIGATFATPSSRWHRLTRTLEQGPAAAEDALGSPSCHRLLRACRQPEHRMA